MARLRLIIGLCLSVAIVYLLFEQQELNARQKKLTEDLDALFKKKSYLEREKERRDESCKGIHLRRGELEIGLKELQQSLSQEMNELSKCEKEKEEQKVIEERFVKEEERRVIEEEERKRKAEELNKKITEEEEERKRIAREEEERRKREEEERRRKLAEEEEEKKRKIAEEAERRRIALEEEEKKRNEERMRVGTQSTDEVVEGVSMEQFRATKFGYQWLLSLSDEDLNDSSNEGLKKASMTPLSILPTKSSRDANQEYFPTSMKCYELFHGVKKKLFGELFGPMSTGSVCVLENMCVMENGLVIVGEDNSHYIPEKQLYYQNRNTPPPPSTIYSEKEIPYHFAERQRFDFPATLNGAGFKLTGKLVSSTKEFFTSTNIDWIDEFSWVISNSYSRHTAHWFETISQLFLAKHYLPESIIPEAKRVYFTNHGSGMFDWQLGTLFTSLKQSSKPEIFHSFPRPTCFKKVAIPGYQFYMFPNTYSGIAYKHHTYQYLNLPIPTTIPKVITFASRSGKRKVANENEFIEYLKKVGGNDIEVRVVKFGSQTFQQQVETMHGSGVLISMHGADLTNLMFLPTGGVALEMNPYRFYDDRFWGISPTVGVRYFSYNCGKASCSSQGGSSNERVKNWPISGYPPATNNDCRAELDINGKRDSDLIVNFDDFGFVLQEVFGHLGWGPKVGMSVWNL